MLIIDSAMAAQLKKAAAIQEHAEQVEAWCELEAVNACYLLDEETDPTRVPRRIGRAMTGAELERRIVKFCPKMRFFSGPKTSATGFKKMILPGPNGEELWSCVYHGDIMPERTIMMRETKDIPDLGQKVLHRADLPRYEFVPGHGYIWDPRDLRPGFKRVDTVRGPAKKGWRQILLEMVADRVARVEDVERHFYGADSTPEWAGATGRRAVSRPW